MVAAIVRDPAGRWEFGNSRRTRRTCMVSAGLGARVPRRIQLVLDLLSRLSAGPARGFLMLAGSRATYELDGAPPRP